MNRLLFLFALLALNAPFLVTAGRNSASSSRGRPPTRTEEFEAEYASIFLAVEKGTSQQNIDYAIKDLQDRPAAHLAALLRHTWPEELDLVHFWIKFEDFKQHLPVCKDRPLRYSQLEKFQNVSPWDEPLFTWNPDTQMFTVKMKANDLKISFHYDLIQVAPKTLDELVEELKFLLGNFFWGYLGGAGRSQLEDYLVGFAERVNSIGIYENPFDVKWYELLRMHFDARNMKEYAKDPETARKGEDFYNAIDKVVAWIRFGRDLRSAGSQTKNTDKPSHSLTEVIAIERGETQSRATLAEYFT